jgi:hypothetical protein
MNIVKSAAAMLVLAILFGASAGAETRIAVLNFELNDITSMPNTPAELKRTSTMAPLLMEALAQSGVYRIAAVDTDSQKAANAGFGYLFRFHDLAAQLGREQGADWILVGQHSKPSFLFSYLWVYLIDVKKQAAVARYDIELKGNHPRVTQHGIDALSAKIQATLAAYQGK